eukprot:TRINITY_DN4074_c0_g2_i1.p2 TRINITY_DN4074_c0_g2~~TRINITY_DN4074_c0_g2_i1.p2  ORF type:complete len:274 (-),score=-17.71 TRINITY_DN4074_c0_g2_i1:379-1137(-)
MQGIGQVRQKNSCSVDFKFGNLNRHFFFPNNISLKICLIIFVILFYSNYNKCKKRLQNNQFFGKLQKIHNVLRDTEPRKKQKELVFSSSQSRIHKSCIVDFKSGVLDRQLFRPNNISLKNLRKNLCYTFLFQLQLQQLGIIKNLIFLREIIILKNSKNCIYRSQTIRNCTQKELERSQTIRNRTQKEIERNSFLWQYNSYPYTYICQFKKYTGESLLYFFNLIIINIRDKQEVIIFENLQLQKESKNCIQRS